MRPARRAFKLFSLSDVVGALIQDSLAAIEAGIPSSSAGQSPPDLPAGALVVDEVRVSLPMGIAFGQSGGDKPFPRRPRLARASGSAQVKCRPGRLAFGIGYSFKESVKDDDQISQVSNQGES